jgi:hypothetical protein
MRLVVFLGPTLAASEARRYVDAVFLPPAAFGDVYRAALTSPFAIGIVDGYFEHRPAVWHKEVLWALSQGIHVFGAASLGALRAAELDVFGMKGVGQIYRAFRAGDLTDDDEVAVAHADASWNYRASSEAMVNIRATLAAAEETGVISSPQRLLMEQLAKSSFYPERSYSRLLKLARRAGVDSAALTTLSAFIETHRVDLKTADALELLAIMKDCAERAEPAHQPAFELSATETWSQLRAWAHRQPTPLVSSTSVDRALLAAEVRGLGANGAFLLSKAMVRAASNAMQEFDAVGVEARQRWVDRINTCIVDEAQRSEFWHELVRRAQDKQQRLEGLSAVHGDVNRMVVPNAEILEWYLARIGSELPGATELACTEVLGLGLSDVTELEREALREYLYVTVLDR